MPEASRSQLKQPARPARGTGCRQGLWLSLLLKTPNGCKQGVLGFRGDPGRGPPKKPFSFSLYRSWEWGD